MKDPLPYRGLLRTEFAAAVVTAAPAANFLAGSQIYLVQITAIPRVVIAMGGGACPGV
jgi:hypothetical protein